ncbi:hypothetical protein QUA41_27190 [Microcoleus sp. Pol11C1]
METGSGADTSGCGGVAGNELSGVSDAVGVAAGDTTCGEHPAF